MPRPRAVWINTIALGRTLEFARQGGANPDDLVGAERALAAGEGGPNERFTMLMQHGFGDVWDLLWEHPDIRHRAYTLRVFGHLLAKCDKHGLVVTEADELAARCKVPRAAIYTVLVDLERIAKAITRHRKGRSLRAIQLTPKVKREPRVQPQRRNGPGRVEARPAAS